MSKRGLAGAVVTAMSAAMSATVIGFAGTAQADDGYPFGGNGYGNGNGTRIGGDGWSWGDNYGYNRDRRNNPWLGQLFPSVKVPRVDTSVRN
ncbi:hypothetical protein [Mycolicibacterium vaccae]|uniref:hypothetical protein n=1 Tax=Mycolicibacterium vaccae TaxID=1810 RepID=UPI003D046918